MNRQHRVPIKWRAAVVIGASALVSVGLAAPAWGNGKDREFVGYLVRGHGHVRSVSAEFTIPTTTCKSNAQIALGPGVYLQQSALDTGRETYSGADEEVECSGPGVAGSLYIGVFINTIAHQSIPVMPNDVISVSVRRHGKKITVTATDHTSKATFTATAKEKHPETYALLGYYQPDTDAWHHPHTSQTSFTHAKVNGAPLSHAHARAINCVRGHTVQYRPSKITHGEDFTIKFLHS